MRFGVPTGREGGEGILIVRLRCNFSIDWHIRRIKVAWEDLMVKMLYDALFLVLVLRDKEKGQLRRCYLRAVVGLIYYTAFDSFLVKF